MYMAIKKIAIIGVVALVVIGCVLAAGCTSNITQQQSTSDVSNGTQDSAYQPERVYDLEHHYFQPEFLDYLETRTDYPYFDGTNIKINELSNFPLDVSSLNTDSTVIEEITNLGPIRLSTMDDAGITTGVVSSSYGIEMTSIPKEEAVKYARLTNDAVAEAVKKYPGRFLGTITLPTPYVEESIAELERCVNELGLQYWHTHSNFGEEYLYEEKFEPLLAKCAELDVPIYLHPATPSDSYLLDSGESFATAAFGYSVDVMKTSYRLIVSGIFDRYPNLKLILGHMGEFYPYCLTRMDNRISSTDSYIKCKEDISYYFKNKNILMTTSGITDPNTIDCAIKTIGIDNIMFATDYPYETIKEEVDFIKSLPISDEDKDKIFYKNAEKYVLKDRTPKSA